MTIQEASDVYQYDVSLTYWEGKWHWDINGGYSSVGSKHDFDTPAEAEAELIEFLKTFQPFEK